MQGRGEIESNSDTIVAKGFKEILMHVMYISGNSRAVLCKEDKDGKIVISQLSPDHTFKNEDELLRLSHLGLDMQNMRREPKTGLQTCTRCIGNYTVKGGYKEFDNLAEAREEPIIAEPNIVGGISIDSTCKFLILMSDGLYKSVEEATNTANANTTIVNMLLDQFQEQSTLNGVAQAVVDKVVRMHHDAFMRDCETPKRCQKRDDITLLVRKFNCLLPNAHDNPGYQSSHAFITDELQKFANESESNTLAEIQSIDSASAKTDFYNEAGSAFMNDATSLTSNSSESAGPQILFQSASNVSLDENGRIKPYVDFSDFFIAAKEACKSGLVPEDWCNPA
ncbi:TGF-beta-activated kinase 1 and MAP3K7-binding protein 1-like [Uloborus diversus]|uniref:TGF-beta-activated kinase 1 and MAP3K7-binding protein 1-like n=1 Tax=Uloborus diversus TaxID=327109 RepID=UPI00240A71FA|nr:TGF-beta-activated kinase 1 and MAP3K7-binding protein 1-like [Uloborus diversus]